MPTTRALLSTIGMRCTLCFSIRHAASATLLSGRDATGGADIICKATQPNCGQEICLDMPPQAYTAGACCCATQQGDQLHEDAEHVVTLDVLHT